MQWKKNNVVLYQGRWCMDQVFAVRQVYDKYLANWERCSLGIYRLGQGI